MKKESAIEEELIGYLTDLKYTYRPDIRTRDALENNFRQKFNALNRVNLTDNEYSQLMDKIINPDVFVTAQLLREQHTLTRDDGTPLYYTLVNIQSWCKNEFEVVNQLRMNTRNSHHRYDVILLINGIPVVQIELKSYHISPRKAMQQIIDYKNDRGNGYANSLLCFMQLFIVSNGSMTRYFANNNNEHFNFAADEQFLPVYEHAEKDNTKVNGLDKFAPSFLSKCSLGEMISRYMVLVALNLKVLLKIEVWDG